MSNMLQVRMVVLQFVTQENIPVAPSAVGGHHLMHLSAPLTLVMSASDVPFPFVLMDMYTCE